MTNAAEVFGSTSLSTVFLKKILRMKSKKHLEAPFILLHKSIDIYSDDGGFLVGLREDFLKPDETSFHLTDRGGCWEVRLNNPPKTSFLDDNEPLERLSHLPVIQPYTQSHGNMPHKIHHYPPDETRSENKLLSVHKMDLDELYDYSGLSGYNFWNLTQLMKNAGIKGDETLPLPSRVLLYRMKVRVYLVHIYYNICR